MRNLPQRIPPNTIDQHRDLHGQRAYVQECLHVRQLSPRKLFLPMFRTQHMSEQIEDWFNCRPPGCHPAGYVGLLEPAMVGDRIAALSPLRGWRHQQPPRLAHVRIRIALQKLLSPITAVGAAVIRASAC